MPTNTQFCKYCGFTHAPDDERRKAGCPMPRFIQPVAGSKKPAPRVCEELEVA